MSGFHHRIASPPLDDDYYSQRDAQAWSYGNTYGEETRMATLTKGVRVSAKPCAT